MARRRLNKNLVVVLTLSGFALMILLAVLMLGQLQKRDPKYFVALAERSAEQQQWQQAALFYNEAWDRSGDTGYLVQVGEMLLREGEVNKAIACWRQALVHQPDLLAAHERQLALMLQLARLYGTPQRWEQLRDAAEAMLRVVSGQTPKQEAFAHHANGLALLNLESRDAANTELGIRELQEASTLDSEVVEYSIDLAAQFARHEKFDEAERVFRELMDRHGSPGANASKVRLAFAQYLTGRSSAEPPVSGSAKGSTPSGGLDEAAEYFAQSLKLAEGDAAALREAQMGYAQFLVQRWAIAMRDESTRPSAQALYDEAEAILRQCIDADPDAFDAYLQMATLYKFAARHADVVQVCDRRISRGLSRKGVEATQSKLSIFSLMIYASEACVALSLATEDLSAKEQWLTRAEQYVADAKGESPSHPRMLSQSGRVKLARGQDRLALKDLRAADEAYGAFDAINWENKIILAQVHLRLNEAGAAKEVLEGVLEHATRGRGANPLFWNLYAQTLFQNNELDRALAVSDRILLANPADAQAKQLKAAIFERQGKLSDAGRILLSQELTGSPAVSALLQARAAMLDGDAEQALEILLLALEADHADAGLLSAAVRELINRDRHEDAQALVSRAILAKPNDRQIAKLGILTRRDLTEEQRDQAMLELNQTAGDAFEGALDLIGFYSRKNDLPQTLHWISEAEQHLVAKDTPLARNATATQHRALLKAKVRVAAQINDTAAMDAARDAAVKFNVDGAGGKSILGWYHLQRREYDLALSALREAVQAQPTDAPSFAHLGQCLQLLGRTDEALSAYEQAVRLNPNEGLAHYGLAFLALSRDDKETFQRELAICERLIPGEPWIQEQVLLRMEGADPAGAVRRREALQKERPEDANNLQRLAALYETLGDRLKADEAYTRLLKLSPEDEKSIQAAAGHHRRAGRPEQALELVTNYAKTRATPEQQAIAHYLVASEHLQQGNTAEAEKTLLAAEGTAQTVEIARALAKFYMQFANQPEKAAEWCAIAVERARRMKSPLLPNVLEEEIACLLHRKVNDIEQARKDVEELRISFPNYTRGLLWESEIHDRSGNIDRAIASLTEYLSVRSNDPYALFQRARHQVSRGRLGAAIEDLSVVKRTNPLALELQPRLMLGRLQQRLGRKDLWIAELEALAKDAPDSATAVEELARAYLQEKRLDDADRIVTAQINRSAKSPAAPTPVSVGAINSDGRWLLLRGRISLDRGDGNKALADFRRGAEVSDFSPETVANVMTAYLRLGRFAEGVEYFERYGGEKPTATSASRYAQLLAKAGNKTKAVEQFRQAMALALAGSVNSSPQDSRVLVLTEAIRAVADEVLATFTADEAMGIFAANAPEGALGKANERILIRAYTAAKRYDDAAARLDALVSAEGGAVDAHERAGLLQELGDVHQVADQPDRAIRAYEEARKYDADNWITQNNIAYLLSDKRGDNQAALPFAQRAVALKDNAFTLDTLGWIYVGLEKYSLAIAELSRGIQLDPDYSLLYYHLGEAYRRNAQFSEAADVLKIGRVVADNSKDAELVGLIETALEKSSRRDAAR